MKSVIFLVCFCFVNRCYPLDILGVFPYPGRSHMVVFETLMKGLATKGHNVTVISQFPLKNLLKNYRHIKIEPEMGEQINVLNVEIPTFRKDSYMGAYELAQAAEQSCENIYNSKEVQVFLESSSKFDVIITEFFNSDCFLVPLKKLKAPVVGVQSCTLMPWTSNRFANPVNPAYIPNNFLPFSDKMTFLERLENTVLQVIHELFYEYYILSQDERIARKYLKGEYNEPLKEVIMQENNLILVNTHFSLNLPRAYVPNVVEIGGIHVGNIRKRSQDLEKWINGSEHGVIYFSLGSMIKGHTLPEEKRKAFLNAFARLPQRVVWKWENETMPDKPQNVLIKKWMPQSDILAHPNIKAFISHGGLLGTIEAVNYGVPVVVMPQFGDQHTNAKALEKNGGGVILELADVTEETVYNALTTVLDPNFKKQAEELSARFRDRPLPPLETAIYWVEYVARHKGAHHMKTAAVGMPFYKYYLLDVFAFLTAVLAIHLYLAFVPIRFVVRKIRGCKKDAQKTKEKKQ